MATLKLGLLAAACILCLGFAAFALIQSKSPKQIWLALLGLIAMTLGLSFGWNFLVQSLQLDESKMELVTPK